MDKIYRQGAIGALLDEYERAIADLKNVIEKIPDKLLTVITDPDTGDENCRSIQAILAHVVHSGYGYATSIHNMKGNIIRRPGKIFHTTVKEYVDDLTSVFTFTENIFKEIKDDELEQFNDSLKIQTGWGQLYDTEQLTEHAIVHILRHRRQIERITLKELGETIFS
ncbi:MAG: DinB family protein [Ferruginibacter sp.]